MTQINSYLTFNGNCREAMLFYKQCFGGELTFLTIGESPLTDRMSSKIKGYILHSTLTSGGVVIMGSDMAPDELIRGNTVSLMVNCCSEEEIREYYSKLAANGSADHPLEGTFWGALFGDLIDKFGNHWLLSYIKS